MDNITVSIFPDDTPEDIFDRLSFVLLELGVRTERVDEDDEVLTFQLSKAELLDDEEEGVQDDD